MDMLRLRPNGRGPCRLPVGDFLLVLAIGIVAFAGLMLVAQLLEIRFVRAVKLTLAIDMPAGNLPPGWSSAQAAIAF